MDKTRKLLLTALFGASLAVTACSDSANAQRGDAGDVQEMGLSNADMSPEAAALAEQNRVLEGRVDVLEREARAARDASMPVGDLLLWLAALTALAASVFAMLRGRAMREELDTFRARGQKRSEDSNLGNDLNMLKGQVSNMSADYREFKSDVSAKLAAAAGAPPQYVAPPATTDKYAAVNTSKEKPAEQAKPTAAPKDDSAFQKKIAAAFNSIEKPEDIAAFEAEFAPQSYTNDRNNGVANIFEDRRARFWLVTSPDDANKAYLIPGSDTKKNWLKYKDKVPDHPFEHHFALSAGSNLRLIKPATIAKGGEGWELEVQGQIEGVL